MIVRFRVHTDYEPSVVHANLRKDTKFVLNEAAQHPLTGRWYVVIGVGSEGGVPTVDLD